MPTQYSISQTDQLYQLIYASKTKPGTTMESYLEILRKSRLNNRRNGLTGMLAFGDGCFLQILEGDRRTVWRTFSKISNDPRHRDIELIDFSAATERLFGEWSMQSVAIRQKLLQKLQFEDSFRPHNWSADSCLLFAIRYSLLSSLSLTSDSDDSATTAPVKLKADRFSAASATI
ncbi:MAG: BLUF domain-containing protein [Planctomycetota bacterium]